MLHWKVAVPPIAVSVLVSLATLAGLWRGWRWW
jgi:hypothetical protein